ncbi:unnamed protein product [Closterium sp. Yama58-4]|nr:unnamed protein product [Closterium sp. Yama58-4]
MPPFCSPRLSLSTPSLLPRSSLAPPSLLALSSPLLPSPTFSSPSPPLFFLLVPSPPPLLPSPPLSCPAPPSRLHPYAATDGSMCTPPHRGTQVCVPSFMPPLCPPYPSLSFIEALSQQGVTRPLLLCLGLKSHSQKTLKAIFTSLLDSRFWIPSALA